MVRNVLIQTANQNEKREEESSPFCHYYFIANQNNANAITMNGYQARN